MLKTSQPPIIDYEGSRYRTDFWEDRGRDYEDLVERAAIQRLMPPAGEVLLEAGAGFGRLAGLYSGYQQVILMDYSLSLLREAQQTWGHDRRFRFVAASIYAFPFVDRLIDTLVMVRVMHHLYSPALALAEIARVLRGNGDFILEYANKRHVKSILRYLLRRQSWNPFDHAPYEFVALNYDFHPTWMAAHMAEAGFTHKKELAISSFRLGALKRLVPTAWLAWLDGVVAGPGAALKLSPSVIGRYQSQPGPGTPTGFFRCPACSSAALQETRSALLCPDCNATWPIQEGIYDFRAGVSRETPGP